MSLKTINYKRSPLSYIKVQSFISSFIRNNKLFIKNEKIKENKLLNVGCGDFPKKEFVNLDYTWRPGVDICWDITKKAYPFSDNSLEGIFTEHCLEHIPFDKCAENIKEFYRILKPNGVLRIVVPDGEIYLDLYQKRKTDKSVILPHGEKEETGMISVNRIFREHGHLFIYDFETFALMLSRAGFKQIKKEKFNEGRDKRIVIDKPERALESLYIEAIK